MAENGFRQRMKSQELTHYLKGRHLQIRVPRHDFNFACNFGSIADIYLWQFRDRIFRFACNKANGDLVDVR